MTDQEGEELPIMHQGPPFILQRNPNNKKCYHINITRWLYT